MGDVFYVRLGAVFDAWAQTQSHVARARVLHELTQRGVDMSADARLRPAYLELMKCGEQLTREEFVDALKQCAVLLLKIFNNELVIKDWQRLVNVVTDLYQELREDFSGTVAQYIPQLRTVDPKRFAISICSVDGQRFHVGDAQTHFSLQSVSKPLTYLTACDTFGSTKVHQHVGCSASGKRFNEFVFMENGLPHNPCINAGAIMTTAFLSDSLPISEQFTKAVSNIKKMAGNEFVGFSNATFLSEKETGFRNYALAYYMMELGAWPEWISDKDKLCEIVDLYFQFCSIEVHTGSLSVIAATLANNGRCPIADDKSSDQTSGSNAFPKQPDSIGHVLSLMDSCGMYDYSGEFAYSVGLPAKSGVSGDLMLVIPNIMGIAIWSPPLDDNYNSVRAKLFASEFVKRVKIHLNNRLPPAIYKAHDTSKFVLKAESSSRQSNAETSRMTLCIAVRNDDVDTVRALLLSGVDPNAVEELQRSSIHFAAFHRRLRLMKLFARFGAKLNEPDKDRLTPLDFTHADDGPMIAFLRRNGASGEPGAASRDVLRSLHDLAH
eukprot:m.371612 g.371612  ORF g.371612 m.371612 type:complete len:551 (-) comp56141_c0_seq1:375-2027(-)